MKYEQISGKLFDEDTLIGIGWAGHLEGKNNPAMQSVKGIGPLPVGNYTIGDPVDGTHLGPTAFPLVPDPTNNMYGRSGFYLHAIAIEHPELSSDGCIVMSRNVRAYVKKKIGATLANDSLRQLVVY